MSSLNSLRYTLAMVISQADVTLAVIMSRWLGANTAAYTGYAAIS